MRKACELPVGIPGTIFHVEQQDLEYAFAMGLFRLIVQLFAQTPGRENANSKPATEKETWEKSAPVNFERPARQPRATAWIPPITSHPEPQAALVGRCWVIDGDTIDIQGNRIRLAGIDAPEIGHPYGNNAKFFLVNLCKGTEVRAVFDGALSHDRSVATCYLPDGRDLAAEMVRAGMALDWAKFSNGKYRHLEPHGVRKRLWRCVARQNGKMPPSMPD